MRKMMRVYRIQKGKKGNVYARLKCCKELKKTECSRGNVWF